MSLLEREAAVAAVEDALADARAGRGRVIVVGGEAGIGKSRLVSEVLAGVEDVTVVTAPCEQYESSTAYFPFRRLLRDALAVPGDLAPHQVVSHVADRVAARAPGLVPFLPLDQLIRQNPAAAGQAPATTGQAPAATGQAPAAATTSTAVTGN